MMLIPELAANAKFKKGVEEIKVRLGVALTILGFLNQKKILILTFLSMLFPVLQLLLTYCTAFGVSNAVRVEPSLARGLDYYTGELSPQTFNTSQKLLFHLSFYLMNSIGSIYEAVIPNGLPGVADDEGQPVGVGSVAGGGR